MDEQLKVSEITEKKTQNLVPIFIVVLVSMLIISCGVYVYQKVELYRLESEIESLYGQVGESTESSHSTVYYVVEDEDMRPSLETIYSLVDSKKLEYRHRLTIGLYMGGIPIDVYYEQYGGPSEGRLVVYHASDLTTNRNEGAFVVREENSPCLTQLIPVTNDNSMRFVAEYICGDSQQLRITSFSLDSTPTIDLKDVSIDSSSELNLNDYFSSVYMKSYIEVIGWQSFDQLLVNQVTNSKGTDGKKQELYLFNVETMEKQLIHTIE